MGGAIRGMRIDFQSTLLREERLPMEVLDTNRNFFQSTLLREERLILRRNNESSICFQSTLLREERLRIIEQAGYVKDFSIHAPTRGAT